MRYRSSLRPRKPSDEGEVGMKESVPKLDPAPSFEKVAAEDRRRVVRAHIAPSLAAFFPVVFYIGVMEWITRPTHRTAVLIVGVLYATIGAVCYLWLRWRPQWAVGIAIGGISAMAASMLSYSPMVRGSGELSVL